MRFRFLHFCPLLSEAVHSAYRRAIQATLHCSLRRVQNAAIVYRDTSLIIVSSHSHQYNHVIRSYTEFIFHCSPFHFYTHVYCRLLPTQENITTYWFFPVSSVFCPSFDFPLLRVFLAPSYFFAISEEPDFFQSTATSALSYRWLGKFSLRQPSHSHFTKNCFTLSASL